MTHQRNLIYVGLNRWDTIWQRAHHLAQNLSQVFRVLYVDPVAYSIMGYLYSRLKGEHSRNLRPIARSINQNLTVFTPPPLIPFSFDNEFINRIDHALLAQMIRRLLHELDMKRPILWLTFPVHAPLLGQFGEALVCYDCMDNYSAFFPPGSRRAKVATHLEKQILSQADLVIATAQSLQDRLKTQHRQVHLVRNAVGAEFLNHQPTNPPQTPPDWPAGNGPVIGYMGTISHWLDLKAMTQLATRHPGWRFVFIGPSEVDLSAYSDLTNLYFLGAKPYNKLADYVARFDVALIPFFKNELTVNVNPVKIYEYFALGKPVVATNLPELLPFSEICYLADNSSEFVRQVEQAVEDLKVPNPTVQARRKAIAQANTWTERAATIVNILENQLAMKQTV